VYISLANSARVPSSSTFRPLEKSDGVARLEPKLTIALAIHVTRIKRFDILLALLGRAKRSTDSHHVWVTDRRDFEICIIEDSISAEL